MITQILLIYLAASFLALAAIIAIGTAQESQKQRNRGGAASRRGGQHDSTANMEKPE